MANSFLEVLRINSSRASNKIALSFLEPNDVGGKVTQQVTYGLLAAQTDQLAIWLLEKGLRKGSMAVLVYPPSLDFVIAFIACLKAGIIAVPVFPPHPDRKNTLVMFSRIVDSSGAKVALTNSSYSHLKKLSAMKDVFNKIKRSPVSSSSTNTTRWPGDLSWLVTDAVDSRKGQSRKHRFRPVPPSPTDLAFLQYTSGSTSDPKGVMITHGNLADNLTKIISELEANTDTIVVSWLPQYHDMGLIGSYLGALYCEGSGYYMSPLTFLQRPMIWLEAVSRFRATHLQAPNFAFKLTARKFKSQSYYNCKRQSMDYKNKILLDLSCVRHIINAAEPVTEESIDLFTDTFAPFGLRKEVMFPTYGLAEHTVFVSSGGKQRLTVSKEALEKDGIVQEVDKNASPSSFSRLIGCGFPSRQGVDVRIVDPVTLKMRNDDEVGEIWIKSESKAAGYYNLPDESQTDFFAHMEGTDRCHQADGYLRSGDLGFMHQSELFICGRIKDIIIIGGRNYYPQDVEGTAESSSEKLRPGCSAAFTIDPINGGREQVALVAELRDVPEKQELESVCTLLVENIRSIVTQEHSLTLSTIILLRPKTVPKTTSGKIARSFCRKAFLEGKLDAVYKKSFVSESIVTDYENSIHPTNEDAAPNDESRDIIAHSRDEIMSMSKSSIVKLLTHAVSEIVNLPESSIKKNVAIVSMMDSLSITQFKGLLDAQFHTKVSDEYLFREDITLNKLADIVKSGTVSGEDTGQRSNHQTSATEIASTQGGIAGALGCPPGVVCAIL